MSGKVLDNFDVKIVDSYVMRSRITDYLNDMFQKFEMELEQYKLDSGNWRQNQEKLHDKWLEIKHDLALLEALGIIRSRKCDELYDRILNYLHEITLTGIEYGQSE